MKQFAFILLGVLLSFAGYAQKPADYEKASYKVVKDLLDVSYLSPLIIVVICTEQSRIAKSSLRKVRNAKIQQTSGIAKQKKKK